MSEGDVDIRVGAPGAKKAAKDLQEVAKSSEQVGRKGRSGGKAASEGFSKTEGAIDKATAKLKGFIGAFAGFAAARKALAEINEEIRATEEASNRAAQSLRGVLALSTLQREPAEVREQVWQYAIESGAPVEQVAPAYYALLGGTAGMGPERRNALMAQSLAMWKTDPRASLESIVGLMGTLGTQQPQLAPLQLGNLASRTIEQAKATPGEMAMYLPQIMTTAKAGGVDAATAAAMFSFATRRGGGVAKSGTAVNAAILGLLAPPPDTAKALAGYGYDQGAPLMERIAWLARAGGQMPPELVAALGGRRGLQAISAISAEPEAFREEVAGAQRALTEPGSLLAKRLQRAFTLPEQRYAEETQRAKVLRDKMRQQPDVLKDQAVLELYDLIMQQQGGGAAGRWVARGEAGMKRALGFEDLFWGTRITPAERGLMGLVGDPWTMDTLLDAYADPGVRAELQKPVPGGMRPDAWAEGILLQRGFRKPATYSGGTHFHGTYEDPAGEAVPQRAE